MKKYRLLLSTVLAILFCFGFLFYKHEYDKIYNVLQVLDTFGDPKIPCTPCKGGDSIPDHWRQVEDTHISVFSAYWDSNGNRAIILGAGDQINISLTCWLWFEFDSQPIEGKLTILDSQNTQVVFSCSNDRSMGAAYGLLLAKHMPGNKGIIYIHPEKKASNSLSACVEPLKGPFIDRLLLAQFLQYHSVIGVNNFVVYDSGISPQVRELLVKQSREIGIIIDLISWNSAIGSTETFVRDCIYRNRGSYVYLTSVNSLLVLDRYTNVTDLLNIMDPAHSVYKLQPLHFCTNEKDDPITKNWKPKLLPLQKTKWIAKEPRDSLALIVKSSDYNNPDHKTIVLPFTEARYHTYDSCSITELQVPSLQDRTMHKYIKVFKNSPLLSSV